MHLTIFIQIIHSSIDTNNPRWRTFLAFFKKDCFLDLMIINFENIASHKYIAKVLRVYEWLDQKWVGIHFLFLSKNDINSVLKIPVANFCHLIILQIHLLGKPVQGDPKRCVPIFCSIKNPFFNECLFCCRTW